MASSESDDDSYHAMLSEQVKSAIPRSAKRYGDSSDTSVNVPSDQNACDEELPPPPSNSGESDGGEGEDGIERETTDGATSAMENGGNGRERVNEGEKAQAPAVDMASSSVAGTHPKERRGSVENLASLISGAGMAFQADPDWEPLETALKTTIQEVVDEQKRAKMTERLRTAFGEVDTDGSGTISKDEFLQLLRKFEVDDSLADQIFTEIDVDGSGEIEFDEWVAAIDLEKGTNRLSKVMRHAMGKTGGHIDFERANKRRRRLLTAFTEVDKDKGGTIDKAEFTALLGILEVDVKDADTIFAEIDTDGNGEIDFDEWVDAVDCKKGGKQLATALSKAVSRGGHIFSKGERDPDVLLAEIERLQRKVEQLEVINETMTVEEERDRKSSTEGTRKKKRDSLGKEKRRSSFGGQGTSPLSGYRGLADRRGSWSNKSASNKTPPSVGSAETLSRKISSLSFADEVDVDENVSDTASDTYSEAGAMEGESLVAQDVAGLSGVDTTGARQRKGSTMLPSLNSLEEGMGVEEEDGRRSSAHLVHDMAELEHLTYEIEKKEKKEHMEFMSEHMNEDTDVFETDDKGAQWEMVRFFGSTVSLALVVVTVSQIIGIMYWPDADSLDLEELDDYDPLSASMTSSKRDHDQMSPTSYFSDLVFVRYYTLILWATTVISGLGAEAIMGQHIVHRMSGANADVLWRYAQLLFSLFACVSIFAQSIFGLPFLVFGLWKGGFPETIGHFAHAHHILTHERKWNMKAASFYLQGMAVLLHHGAASFVVVNVYTGLYPLARPLLATVLPLIMQHWFALIKYTSNATHDALCMCFEVMFEMELFGNLGNFTRQAGFDRTARGAGITMIFSHWLFLAAGVIDFVHAAHEAKLQRKKDEEDEMSRAMAQIRANGLDRMGGSNERRGTATTAADRTSDPRRKQTSIFLNQADVVTVEEPKKRQKAKRRGTMEQWSDLSRTYSKGSVLSESSGRDGSFDSDSDSDRDSEEVELVDAEDIAKIVAQKVKATVQKEVEKKRSSSLAALDIPAGSNRTKKLSPSEAAADRERLEMVRLNTPGAASPEELAAYGITPSPTASSKAD